MTRPSRRALLGTLATLSAAGTTPALAAPSPDAALLDLCARANAATDAANAAFLRPYDGLSREDLRAQEAENGALDTAQAALLEEVSQVRATTPEGLRAKAYAAYHAAPHDEDGEVIVNDATDYDALVLLVWSVVEDTVRMAGKATA